MKRFILTGTPGAGKTSILKMLADLGHSTVQEAATDVIAVEQTKGNLQPWQQPNFIDLIVEMQKQRQIDGTRLDCIVQYFDRSPICTYALSSYLDYSPSPKLMHEIDRILNENVYQRQVYFIENLGFCTPTDARKISFEEALVFEKFHRDAYQTFGFECVSIKPAPIEERAAQIIARSNTITP
ncbi:MAG: ATP/GTP-binding protein [Rhizobiaceae bacterium]